MTDEPLRISEEMSEGLARLPERFRVRQAAYVASMRGSGGGWGGRGGGSDLYYTGFALRAADLLDIRDDALWDNAAKYLSQVPIPRSVVDCASLVDSAYVVSLRCGTVDAKDRIGVPV